MRPYVLLPGTRTSVPRTQQSSHRVSLLLDTAQDITISVPNITSRYRSSVSVPFLRYVVEFEVLPVQ